MMKFLIICYLFFSCSCYNFIIAVKINKERTKKKKKFMLVSWLVLKLSFSKDKTQGLRTCARLNVLYISTVIFHLVKSMQNSKLPNSHSLCIIVVSRNEQPACESWIKAQINKFKSGSLAFKSQRKGNSPVSCQWMDKMIRMCMPRWRETVTQAEGCS